MPSNCERYVNIVHVYYVTMHRKSLTLSLSLSLSLSLALDRSIDRSIEINNCHEYTVEQNLMHSLNARLGTPIYK